MLLPAQVEKAVPPLVQSPPPPSPSAHFQSSALLVLRLQDQLCVLPRGWQTGASIYWSGLCLTKRPPSHTRSPWPQAARAHILSSVGRGVSLGGSLLSQPEKADQPWEIHPLRRECAPAVVMYSCGDRQEHRLHTSAQTPAALPAGCFPGSSARSACRSNIPLTQGSRQPMHRTQRIAPHLAQQAAVQLGPAVFPPRCLQFTPHQYEKHIPKPCRAEDSCQKPNRHRLRVFTLSLVASSCYYPVIISDNLAFKVATDKLNTQIITNLSV